MSISNWILSISGVVVLSIMVDMFLPDGKLNSFIKTIFNFTIILVVITPLPNLFKKDYNLEDMFPSQNIVLQEDYIYQLNYDKLMILEEQIEKSFNEKGLVGAKAYISADIFTLQMKIDKVFVDLSQMVIHENYENINIESEVVNCVKKYVDIKKENIIISE